MAQTPVHFSAKVVGARRSVGDYSAIVMKQDTDVWAEDRYGKTIVQGEAGIDDANVIQQAIDFVASNGGGNIVIKAGEYILTSPITTQNKTAIVGENRRTKLIIAHDTDCGIKCENVSNIEIAFLHFTLKDVNTAPPWFIDCRAMTDSYIHHNSFDGLGTTVATGIGISHGSKRNIIDHNLVTNCREGIYFWAGTTDNPNENNTVSNNICRYSYHNGIYADNYTYGLIIVGNQCDDNGRSQQGSDDYGIEVMTYCKDVLISNNICRNNYACGIAIKNRTSNFLVENNIFDGNGAYGIYLEVVSEFVVKGNVVNNTERASGIYMTYSKHGVIEGNTVLNSYESGIFVKKSSVIQIIGNILVENNIRNDPYYGEICLEGSDTTYVSNVHIVSNYIQARTYAGNRGITTNPYVKDIVVLNNEIHSDNPLVALPPDTIIKGNKGCLVRPEITITVSAASTQIINRIGTFIARLGANTKLEYTPDGGTTWYELIPTGGTGIIESDGASLRLNNTGTADEDSYLLPIG